METLQQVDKVKIDFSVPELYANKIKMGANVSVITNENTAKKSATIIATQADINTTTRNLKVRATLNGAPIQPGSFVKVMIESGNSNNIILPTNAIIPEASSKKVVIVKDGKGKFVNVETGLRTASGVEILKTWPNAVLEFFNSSLKYEAVYKVNQQHEYGEISESYIA